MKRSSPKEPCPICNGRAWLWEDVRWVCEGCEGAGIVKDFDGWYRSVMDDWDTASRMLADLSREPEPENNRDRLIHEARVMKAQEEYRRVDVITSVATALGLMLHELSHGSFHVKIPEYNIEVNHEW